MYNIVVNGREITNMNELSQSTVNDFNEAMNMLGNLGINFNFNMNNNRNNNNNRNWNINFNNNWNMNNNMMNMNNMMFMNNNMMNMNNINIGGMNNNDLGESAKSESNMESVNNNVNNNNSNRNNNSDNNINKSNKKALCNSIMASVNVDSLSDFDKKKFELIVEMDEYQYKHIQKYDSRKETECAICIEDFKGIDIIKAFYKCEHIFHKRCLLDWLKKHNTCPLCNHDLSDDIKNMK